MYDFAPEYSALFPRIEDKKIKCITYIWFEINKIYGTPELPDVYDFHGTVVLFHEAPRAQFDN